jgi:hypothetical protein
MGMDLPITDHGKDSIIKAVIDGLTIHDAVLLNGTPDTNRDHVLFFI